VAAQNSNGLTIRSVTASTAATPNDDVIVMTNAGAVAITLPAASSMEAGKVYRFSNQGAGVLTVQPNGSDKIDGLGLCSVNALAGGVPGTRIIVSDGSNWFSIASH
jgi:hypothetical protein